MSAGQSPQPPASPVPNPGLPTSPVPVPSPQPGPRPVPPPGRPDPTQQLVDPADARATLEARRELGPEMEQALVDSFTQRVEAALVSREQSSQGHRDEELATRRAESRNQMALGIVSMVMAIPLTAIFLNMAGLLGGIICWVGIVLVNMAFALRRHRD